MCADLNEKEYIDVIENTPQIQQHARWIYGMHPSDELLRAYIDRGEMYVLVDDEDAAGDMTGDAADNVAGKVAGLVVISMCQDKDYEAVAWQEALPNDQVATLHLLAVCPAYRGRSLGMKILEEAMDVTVQKGKKALRLDTLRSNLPAQRMYERAGFSYRGEQELYTGNTGMAVFMYYEKIPPRTSM